MENFGELKSLEILSKSLNSNIYRIEYKNKNAIIKRYKSNDKMRLNREFSALSLLNKSCFQYVPKLLEINRKENHIIMSKLEGISPKQDLNFTIDLANHINGMQNYVNKKDSLKACDAAFNIKDHFKIVENKIIYILNKFDFNPQEFRETKNMIYEIKCKGNKSSAYVLGVELRHLIKSSFSNFDLIIPIPVSKAKRQIRGFNQCELIAKGF